MPAADYRAARAKVRLGLAELARLAHVSVPTILRIEDDDGHAGVRASTLGKVRAALELAGAMFDADGAYHEPTADERGPADPFAISAARFRRARTRTQLSPRQLIELTGLTHPTLKAVERGAGPPRVARDTVLRVVEAYRTVGYRFCANPAADYLDGAVLGAWRANRGEAPDVA